MRKQNFEIRISRKKPAIVDKNITIISHLALETESIGTKHGIITVKLKKAYLMHYAVDYQNIIFDFSAKRLGIEQNALNKLKPFACRRESIGV